MILHTHIPYIEYTQEKELLKAVEPVRDEETKDIQKEDDHDASSLHYGTGFVLSSTCNDDRYWHVSAT